MKITGFMSDKKSYIKKVSYVVFAFFVAGVILGAVYCVFLDDAQNSSVNRYLSKYFTEYAQNLDYIEVFKCSMWGYLKSFFVIYFCSFVRVGMIGSVGTVALKGFASGFATASFVKLYGVRGLLITGANFLSQIIYLPALMLLCAASVNMSQNAIYREKEARRRFNLLAICCLTIFCITAVFDAVITTTFMKLIRGIFVN